jgi:signal transduction histidine kinase
VWSPTARFSLLALLAIAVPATIVAILGYISIRQWEASSELLYREQARDMASMAAAKVEMMLRREEDAFLDQLQGALNAESRSARAVGEVLARSPLVRRLYLVTRRGELLYPRAWQEGDAAVIGPLVAEAQGTLERGGRREDVRAEARRQIVVAGHRVCVAFLTGRGGEPVLAAFIRDPEALRREIFETALGALESPTNFAVLDHEGRAVYSRTPVGDVQPILTVTFRDTLPDWRLAVYQTADAAPRRAVRRQVMLFTGAYGVLLLVIIAGIVATWQLTRRETEMARLKSDFVANVSHDLKTPLSVIRMFGETLDMGRITDEGGRREYYRVITRESERLSRLIDNVLDFSRIEGGRQTYRMAPTAVEPVIRSALEAFDYPLAQHGFKVDVEVAPDLPEVPMDADAIGQALANLIDNAIKYSGEERALTVSARVVDGRLAISVADRGLGIPAHEHARIFEKFYRVGRSDTQGRRGSGVGLALVRHIAEAHGGDVIVASAPGEGSRFTLRLPLTGRRDG